MTTDIKTIIEKLAGAAAEGGESVVVPTEACMTIVGHIRSLELARDNWRTQAQLESEASLAHAMAESAVRRQCADLEAARDKWGREYFAEREANAGLEQERDMWRDRVNDVEETLKDERAAHLATQRALVWAMQTREESIPAPLDERSLADIYCAAREAVEKAGKEGV